MQKEIINVGCGMNILPGAINIDNSPSVRIAKHKLLRKLIRPFMNKSQSEYLDFAIRNNIIQGDAKSLPCMDNSIDVIYTSHMIEHLDLPTMNTFVSECHRCLKPGGILRIVTPDLDILFDHYLKTKDAIDFAQRSTFYRSSGRQLKERLRVAISGDREHKIIYNKETLSDYLVKHNFVNVECLPAGQTNIPFETGIDLYWREKDSIYVEARK